MPRRGDAVVRGRMNCELARRRRENEPPLAGVNRTEPQDVAKEGSRAVGIFRVNDGMSAVDKGGHSLLRLIRVLHERHPNLYASQPIAGMI